MQFNNPLASEKYLERIDHRDEDVRGPYFRDQTAIIHSMPYRRLKHKAQVFFSPKNDHICTRIEHALHVATISATIARALELNIDMAYAIGLGHDLGHAPFGHHKRLFAAGRLERGVGDQGPRHLAPQDPRTRLGLGVCGEPGDGAVDRRGGFLGA